MAEGATVEELAEFLVPMIAKEVIREVFKELRKLGMRPREPRAYLIGYVSAYYDAIQGYTHDAFKGIFKAATGLEEIRGVPLGTLGRIYCSEGSKEAEAYAVLVETYTVQDLLLSLPESELEVQGAEADAVITVNIRVIPLTQGAVRRLGVVLSRVAVELSKLRGSVSVKVKFLGARPGDVEKPERGKVMATSDGVEVVFYDISEPRVYRFDHVPGLLGCIARLFHRVKR